MFDCVLIGRPLKARRSPSRGATLLLLCHKPPYLCCSAAGIHRSFAHRFGRIHRMQPKVIAFRHNCMLSSIVVDSRNTLHHCMRAARQVFSSAPAAVIRGYVLLSSCCVDPHSSQVSSINELRLQFRSRRYRNCHCHCKNDSVRRRSRHVRHSGRIRETQWYVPCIRKSEFFLKTCSIGLR